MLYSTRVHYYQRGARAIFFFFKEKDILGVYSADIILHLRRPNKTLFYHVGTLYSVDSKKAKNMQKIDDNTEDEEGKSYGSICGITNVDQFPDYIKARGKNGLDGYISTKEYLKAIESSAIEEIAVNDFENIQIIDSFGFEDLESLSP